MEQSNEIRLLTVDEARLVLDIGRNTMFKLCKKPGFPCLQIGKQIRIPSHKLLQWIDENAS